MNTVTSENHNALAGFVFLVFGFVFATLALEFQLGSATRMGPGYFPLLLATVLILSGLYQLVQGVQLKTIAQFFKQRSFKLNLKIQNLRIFGFVIGAVLLFGLFADFLGIAMATLLLVLLSGLAYQQARMRELAWLSPLLSVISVLVFSLGLGLPLPILPAFI